MSLYRGFFAAAIILAASPSQACEDLRIESCRLSFTERNLPVPTYGLLGYSQMTAPNALALEQAAAAKPPGCERALIHRLAAMHRAGERLDLARLQAEVANAAAPPAQDGIPFEHERGPLQPRGGFTPGDRPTQRQLEGWRR